MELPYSRELSPACWSVLASVDLAALLTARLPCAGLCWTLYQLSKHQLVQDMVVAQLTGERTDDG